MRTATLLSLCFALYCLEAGLLLLFAPWSPVWDRMILQLPIAWLRVFLLGGVGRSAITGFGLVHVVWGLHDLQALLARWKARAIAEDEEDDAEPDVQPARD